MWITKYEIQNLGTPIRPWSPPLQKQHCYQVHGKAALRNLNYTVCPHPPYVPN